MPPKATKKKATKKKATKKKATKKKATKKTKEEEEREKQEAFRQDKIATILPALRKKLYDALKSVGTYKKPSVVRYQEEQQQYLEKVTELNAKYLKAFREKAAPEEIGAIVKEIRQYTRKNIGCRSVSFICEELYNWTYKKPQADEDIIAELTQIDKEFNGAWNLEGNILFVDTPEVILSHGSKRVKLGRFRMRLDLQMYVRFLDNNNNDYRVKMLRFDALDPVFPEDCEEYVHPHLKSAGNGYTDRLRMCEGDASPALTKAAKAFRIADVFLILQSVLQTYNGDSPFHRLGYWASEKKCVDCAVMMEPRDAVTCSYSSEPICSDCATKCSSAGCDRNMSTASRRACARCRDVFCSNCLTSTCRDCNRVFCRSCCSTGICTGCLEVREEKLKQQADLERERREAGERREARLREEAGPEEVPEEAPADEHITVVYNADTSLW